MKEKIKFTSLFFIIFQLISYSQNSATENLLSTVPPNYFEMNRENFHLQLNKSVYLTTETIWFKGFVFNKKTNQIFTETTNVHVDLLDNSGTKLQSSLCFASNGSFDGSFKLDDKLNSGIYFLQVTTNWCNNFVEDESAVFKVEIINATTGILTYKSNEPQLSFHPEGGSFIENSDNIIGVHITDCLANGIEIADVKVLDVANNELLSFKTNELGYGQFTLINAKNEPYKVRYKYKDKEYEKTLLTPQKTGIAITVNNYANDKNVFITIKTNEVTLQNEKMNDFYLAINQNDQVNFFKFKLEKTVQNITLSQDLFYDGINVIRLLDNNNIQLNERIVYKKYNTDFDINYTIVSKTKDSIKIAATFLNKVAIGISVLPTNSKSSSTSQTIFNSMLISSYLKQTNFDKIDFFREPNRKNNYILDLMLLCQKYKYEWKTMTNPPKELYTFNRGLTIKGTVNTKVTSDNKVEIFSFLDGINETAYLNEKNEFFFKNFIATNDLNLNFALKNDKGEKVELNYLPQLISDEKPFTKNFKNALTLCEADKTIEISTKKEDFPIVKNAINLDAVVVKAGIKKKELDNRFKNGNNNMRGYKISDGEYKMYTNIIQFLNSNGFNAGSKMGTVYITSRLRTSLSKVNSPTVYLDDMELNEFDMLDNFSMQLIDEIFIDKYGTNINSKGGGGVIKIYTNQNYKSKSGMIKSKSFIVKNGFNATIPYINPDYEDVNSEAFTNYGTIFWTPNSGRFEKSVEFTIPNLGQDNVLITTEGISENGMLISNSKVLNLK